MRNLTDSLGTGLMYWGGELVAYKELQAQDGSPYENQAYSVLTVLPCPLSPPRVERLDFHKFG